MNVQSTRGQRSEASGLASDSGVPGKATNCGHVAASGAALKAAKEESSLDSSDRMPRRPLLRKEVRRPKDVGSHRVPLSRGLSPAL